MPGIAGLITTLPRKWAELQLQKMIGTLRHESFYRSGTWIDEQSGAYIGWTAREHSFADEMPIQNEQGDVVLVLAGEEYPEPGTVPRLKERGHECKADGPSYLVHLYEEDPGFLKDLNGRFHGLVADRRHGIATLFNDRFGLQRIYYHEAKDAFYFAAEAKAILEVRPELRALDPRGLGEFVAFGCVLENRTLFKSIYALPPASAWHFRNGSTAAKTSYFEPREWEEQEPLDAETYYGQLRQTFARNLPRYFEGRERIGISLTGGLDTRIIMAWRNASIGTLPCYTFGSMFRENQDVRLARRIAGICGQPYQVVTVGQECLSRFPHYAERTLYLTDGCVDISRSADLYNNEQAREIAPARMVGTFGSEIIRGDLMFKPASPAAGIFQPEALAAISQGAETYRQNFQGNRTTLVAFRQPAAYHCGVLMLEQSQVTIRAPYLDNDLIRTVFRAPRVESGEDVRLRLIRDGSPALARLRTDRGLGGSNGYIRALVRACLEFTFKAEYAYDYGMPQWVAKIDHVFAPLHLERLWVGRHKLFHFRLWYRTILAKYVQEMLLDSRSLARPYLERRGVEGIVSGHLKGNRNYTTEIHRLLSLELLNRLFVDSR
jgi:asparagine synthase (glutamine-hydrolysing)